MRKTHKPLVRDNLLLVTDGDPDVASPVPLGTPRWHEWLAENASFIFEGGAGHLTAQRDIRRGVAYWYAYRRRGGKLSRTYLGKSQELTQARLEQASARLAGQTPLTPSSNGADSAGLMAALGNGPSAVGAAVDRSFLPMTEATPPPLPHKPIARPRLTQRISTPVTVIYAPSGFGKSTVLNEWRQSCGMPVAWVALEADDNHPLRFWSKVVTALQTVNPSLGQSWLSLVRASASALSRIVVDLTNDILRVTHEPGASQGIGLVLDNYHHIRNTEIHTSVQTWLEHIPGTLKMTIASNTKPPLAFGYLRAKGMVVELGADDLRFTLEEGIEFLSQHTPGQHLAYRDMQTLVRRTEGWITGLVLATSALAQQEDRTTFVETFTGAHPSLREFFSERVLHGQPWEEQTFLLKTSILRLLTGPLCDAVMGHGGSAEVLDRLLGENLFLERLEESDWYRYHDLFAETLRVRLREQFPAEIPCLHRRAAKWYREQNDPVDAIVHLLAGKSWEEAAALIESVALHELEQPGEASRLLGWLQQLPEAVIHQHKTLLAVYVRLARQLPPKELDDSLSRTEMSIASAPALQKTGPAKEAVTEIHRIRRLWTTDDQAVLEALAGREQGSVWQMLNGILQYHRECRRDLIRAEAKAGEVYEAALGRGHLFSILMAGGDCANLEFSQGHLRRSEQIAHQVLRQASESRDKLPEPASIALTALSGVYFERNQLTQADKLLERADEVDPDPIRTNESVVKAILRAKLQSTQGDNEAAFATIQAIRESYSQRPSNIWLDQDLNAYQALFCLQQGDVASAERHLGGDWEIDEHPFSAFIQASILIEQDRNAAAEDILRHLLDRYPHGFYWVPILRAQAKLAVALFNQQKVNQARRVMAEAARIAAPEFFVRPFLSPEPQNTSLLALVLHTENLNPGTRSFVKETLTMLGHADGMQETSSRDESVLLAIAASISPREQEILQSLCIGLSNREIAAEFSISASTVKTHLESIYRKLGVGGRTQAIARAHLLKLL